MLNEESLEERLHEDLGRFQPGRVSVDTLISRGKAIKARRRAGLAAGLAAVAGLAVGAPAVLHAAVGSSTASAAGHTQVLASGTIDGKRWSFVLGGPARTDCPDYVAGIWGNDSGATCLGSLPVTTDPAMLTSSMQGSVSLFVAQLRSDVDHVTVTQADGKVLTPAVAQISGRRYAFFALPSHQGIKRLDALGSDGQPIAYALPYNGPDNMPAGLIQLWYPAGTTPAQKSVKQVLFSDTSSSSTPVTITVDMGPFGVCYLISAPQGMGGATSYGPDCHAPTSPDPNALPLRGYPVGQRVLMVAEVNSAVSHVLINLSDGGTTLLTPVPVGGHWFVATFLATGVHYRDATAYDGSGNQLAKTP